MNPWLNPLQVARMYKFLGRNWNIIQFYSKFSWKINGKQWRGKRYPNSKALHIPWKQEYLHPRLKISTNTSTLKRKISKEIVVGMMQIVDDIENKHLLFVWREPSNLQKHAKKKMEIASHKAGESEASVTVVGHQGDLYSCFCSIKFCIDWKWIPDWFVEKLK